MRISDKCNIDKDQLCDPQSNFFINNQQQGIFCKKVSITNQSEVQYSVKHNMDEHQQYEFCSKAKMAYLYMYAILCQTSTKMSNACEPHFDVASTKMGIMNLN